MALDRMTDQEIANALSVAPTSDLSPTARVLINELILRMRADARGKALWEGQVDDSSRDLDPNLEITSGVLSSMFRESGDSVWTHLVTLVGAVQSLEERVRSLEAQIEQ